MGSGNRGDYMAWGKGDVDCDVGLGLNIQFQQQQQQQQQQQHHRGLVRKMMTEEQGGMSLCPPSGVAFTADQRQELERQTVIYKYMMASMPIPLQLLQPHSKLPTTTYGGGGGGRAGGAGDPEPWRCRRTDGKKWRCSRDVAPDQKYCERHSHKGRPSSRSRKPVESLFSPSSASYPAPAPASHSMEFMPSSLVQYSLLPTPRYPHERLMKKDAGRASMSGGDTSLHQDQSSSRPFIDAWSLADANHPSCSFCTITTTATDHLTPTPATTLPFPTNSILPLTLSVSSGIHVDDQHPHISDVTVSDHEAQVGAMRSSSSSSQPLNWMNSWINTPPGGPLAEALWLGMSDSGSYGVRNNVEDLVALPRNSGSSVSGKDPSGHVFRLH